MKIKYFLPAIAGIAMVSCTQEELFNTDTVQTGELSPITFTVNKEEADSRVWQGDENGRWATFSFAQGDLLSLWNGMTWGTSSWTSLGQNAIYEGNGAEGELKFTTRSIVNEGTAILVYPADTAFVNKGTVLKVSLPLEQNADTKQSIPWVSDVMAISAYNEDAPSNSAGYGRNYDVLLRPVGSLFGMKLNPTKSVDFNALGVDPIEYTSVTISDGESNIFATSATITQSATASALTDAEGYDHFEYMTDVEVTPDESSISTTDIAEDNTAYFSLLPATTSITDLSDNVKVTVNTTYGKVEVVNNASATDADKGPLQNTAANTGKNLEANLIDVLNKTWVIRQNSKFGSEKQGQVIRRTLSLDLSTLDMDGTVVSTSKQLIDLLKVYNALEIDESITLKLTGTESNNDFILTKAAIDALNTYNKSGKITLDNNGSGEFKVVLAEGATLDMLASTAVKFDGTITAILSEEATLDQTYDGSKVNAQSTAKVTKVVSNAKLTYTNTKNSSETPSYTLEVNGEMAFNGTNFVMGQFSTTANSEITVTRGQTVTFKTNTSSTQTSLYGKIKNDGIISAATKVANFGYIDNKFEVSVLSGATSAEFINCGEIFNNGNLAVTYITRNANNENTTLGRIILTNRNDNVSVKNVDKKGYIVYTLKDKDENGEYTYQAKTTDVFNWLIVETETLGDVVNLKNDVIYLQIKGEAVTVNTVTDGISVTDLFVNNSMRLLGSNAIEATNIYVNDYILHSGKLSGTQLKSYTSKVYGEEADDTTYANGQIRTVSSN